jgi:antitoxin MazE
MQVAKWGNSLAVRLPAALVQKLGLKPGDEVDMVAASTAGEGTRLEVRRKPSRKEVIDGLRKFAGRLPADYKFSRDEANER